MTKGDYRTFVAEQAPEAERPGKFVGTDGQVLGTHRGAAFYTTGQRRGLGVSSGKRLYVVQIDAGTNTVVLGGDEELLERACVLEEVNLLACDEVTARLRAEVKIRYATATTPATVIPGSEGRLRVEFDRPQRALSPGQSAVLYDGDVVLGGGIIAGRV